MYFFPLFIFSQQNIAIIFSYARDVHFYSSLLDPGEFNLEKEKSVVTLRELFEDNIRDTHNSHQPPELSLFIQA